MNEAEMNKKKKGLLRFMELIDRDSIKFVKAGMLAFLGLIPFMVVLMLAVGTGSPFWLAMCTVAGIIAMPEICGTADTVMRSMRDEIGWWWWDSYKTAWVRNLKATILPGAVFGLLVGLQIYGLYAIAAMENPVKEFWMLFGALLLETAVTGFYLPMLVCMELPAPALLRNCFVLFFSHPIKSLLAALVQLIYYGLILIWFPLTSIILLIASVWLPMLIAVLILYPALDKHFHLTETYEKLRKERWENGEIEA